MTCGPQDQTRGDSTPYLDHGHAASLSHNEVVSLCTKAARGAGFGWGLAEEAGYAAAWLVQHGVDGPDHLHRYLAQAQHRQWRELCPTITAGAWLAPHGRALCPIALGATLCDYAGLPEGLNAGAMITVGPVDHPALLIPFLASIAQASDIVIDIVWDGGLLCIGGDPLAPAAVSLGGYQTTLTLTARSGPALAAMPAASPDIAADTIAALNAFAMRTTVPATEASRAGAGAATSDND